MLAGSDLAECGPGQAGDKSVSSDFSCPPGMIGKRNAKYAARNKGIGPESSTTALHSPEDDIQKDGSRVPEARLVITLFGMLVCIVRGFLLVSKFKFPRFAGIPIGSLLWFGYGVERHIHWAPLASTSDLGAYGTQIVTSTTYVPVCSPS
jgi:hypothetical protein